MSPLVDISRFQLGVPSDQDAEEQAEEAPLLQALDEQANAYINARAWASLVRDKLLAYGVGGIVAVYLVRFAHALPDGDWERWVVVGDLPEMNFETEAAPTPSLALQLYCYLAQDWADTVLSGADISECYPINAPAVKENAEQLLEIISFIREKVVPGAERYGLESDQAGA